MPPSTGTPDNDPLDYLRQFGASAESTEFHSPVPDGYVRGRHKFVVVLGTVMSGLGKGIFSSSLAKLLKDKGLSIAPIKMEGYLNIDSGTLNPFRHGEVFVLADGTECDMDLGTYERMLDQDLSHANFVTSGQVYANILERERKGGFLGRDVQMIPHVTGLVKLRLRELAMTGGPDGGPADVIFIEVGGTVGDYENALYIEALRELAFEEGSQSTCFVALTYILEPSILGEQKSKAAQLGIKRLMEAGIQPHILACRARNKVSKTVMQKVAMYSNVPMKRVFSMHDRESIYTVPEDLWSEGLDREVLSILNLHERVDPVHEDRARRRWLEYSEGIRGRRQHEITLGITGKYTSVRDAYASIDRAVEHASTHLSAKVDIRWLDTSTITSENVSEQLAGVHAIIVPGGFGERGVEGKIACVEYARNHSVPYLGICLGFQVAVIEFARNAAALRGANSTEFDARCPHPVISELPEQKKIEGLGGTMRLGAQDVLLEPDTLAWHLFEPARSGVIRQRFRHRWEVDPAYVQRLEAAGMRFSGRHPDHPIMQVLELPRKDHPYFIAAQFHPELTSRPLAPHPMFMGLIAAAIARNDPGYATSPPPSAAARWLWPPQADEPGEPASSVAAGERPS
ncbi:MAG: CTP synthase [Planctomycetota bacterium]|jgi:CTP synthase